MILSIIIVNYKGWKRLNTCLDSLETIINNSNQFSFEVIVVDNYSNDGILDEFKARYVKFKFIENEGNYGFANGCNLGASNSTGEYLLFLNPDTRILSGVLEKLVKFAQLFPEFGILSTSQLDETGKDTKPYGYFPGFFKMTGFLRAINRMLNGPFQSQSFHDETIIFPDWVSGSVILIRKGLFDNLKGWNEDYWMYYEDVDLSKRVTNLGLKVGVIKDLNIEHNHGGASRINMETKALTKTEVRISKHVYIHNHVSSHEAFLMHSYFIFKNIIMLLILSLLAILTVFQVTKIKLYLRVEANLFQYYLNCLRNSSWLSKRSKKYRSIK